MQAGWNISNSLYTITSKRMKMNARASVCQSLWQEIARLVWQKSPILKRYWGWNLRKWKLTSNNHLCRQGLRFEIMAWEVNFAPMIQIIFTSNISQVCLTIPYTEWLHIQALLGWDARLGSSQILHWLNGGQYRCNVTAGADLLGFPTLWYLQKKGLNND